MNALGEARIPQPGQKPPGKRIKFDGVGHETSLENLPDISCFMLVSICSLAGQRSCNARCLLSPSLCFHFPSGAPGIALQCLGGRTADGQDHGRNFLLKRNNPANRTGHGGARASIANVNGTGSISTKALCFGCRRYAMAVPMMDTTAIKSASHTPNDMKEKEFTAQVIGAFGHVPTIEEDDPAWRS